MVTQPPGDETADGPAAADAGGGQGGAARRLLPLGVVAAQRGLNPKTLYRYVRSGEVYGRLAAESRVGWVGRPPMLVDVDDLERLLKDAPTRRQHPRRTIAAANHGPGTAPPPPATPDVA